MKFDYAVVGGGIVGAATARELTRRRPGARVVVIEKETRLGEHQTGHNSGVIHAGIYYAPGSLKADMCRRGAEATKQYADANGIAWKQTGKLLVATDAKELTAMNALAERAVANQIDYTVLSAGELREREPNISGLGALLIHATGITDYRAINESFGKEVIEAGGEVRLGTALTGVVERANSVVLRTNRGEVEADRAVFCAGIQADRVARMAGLDVDFAMVPFRGEYYDVVASKRDLVSHLIYPIPDPELPFLGVHLTLTVDGGLNVGPNAVLGLAREGYRKGSVDRRDLAEIVRFPGMWHVARANVVTGAKEMLGSVSKRHYLKLCQKYAPGLQLADLTPRVAGIRAQAVMRDGTFVHDFLMRRTARMLHVVNAPSPAATSAMPIAEHIVTELLGPTDA